MFDSGVSILLIFAFIEVTRGSRESWVVHGVAEAVISEVSMTDFRLQSASTTRSAASRLVNLTRASASLPPGEKYSSVTETSVPWSPIAG